MLLKKIMAHFVVLTGMALVVAATHFPPYCANCEEEIWEEVPCDRIPTTSATYITTTSATPTATPIPLTYTSPTPTTISSTTTTITPTTTTVVTTIPTTTITPPTLITTTARIIVYPTTVTAPTTLPSNLNTTTTSKTEFSNCYCECKLGCKEFCRKVIVSGDPTKQVTQLTSTAQQVTDGHIEVKHVHQRKYVSGAAHDSYSNDGVGSPYKPLSGATNEHYDSRYPMETTFSVQKHSEIYKPPYRGAKKKLEPPYPSLQAARYYPDAVLNAASYSVEDLTRLLQLESGGKGAYDVTATDFAYPKADAYSSFAQQTKKESLYSPVFATVSLSVHDRADLPSASQASAIASKLSVAAKAVSPAGRKYAIMNPTIKYANNPKIKAPTPVPYRPPYQPSCQMNDAPSLNGIPSFDFIPDGYLKNYVYGGNSAAHDPYKPSYLVTY